VRVGRPCTYDDTCVSVLGAAAWSIAQHDERTGPRRLNPAFGERGKGGASCHATARHTPPKCRVALVRTTRAAHLTRAPLTAWDGMMAHSEYKRRIKAMEKEVKLKEKEALKVRMPHRPDCCCCGVGSGVNGWSYLHAGTNGHGSGPGCSKAAPSAAPSAVYQAERGSECRALSTASCSRSECVRAGGEGRGGS
jgi:hypothetical protein